MSAILSKLKQAEINFQREKIESLEKEIVKLEGELEEAKAFIQITEGIIGKKMLILLYLVAFICVASIRKELNPINLC